MVASPVDALYLPLLVWLGCYRRLVLLVADLLQPVDMLAVERFLNSDVNHVRRRAGAVPMLFVGRYPDDIAGTHFAQRSAPDLHAADTGGDAKRLTERMGVPIGPCGRFEVHEGRTDARRRRR